MARTRCPGCDADIGTEIYSLPYDDDILVGYLTDFYGSQGCPEPRRLRGETYSLIECNSCRLIYQRSVPTREFAEELYEVWIDPVDAKEMVRADRSAGFYVEMAGEVTTLLHHFGRDRWPLRALDFGMGWGEWSLMARAFGCEVTGMELSEARLRHAHALGIETLSLDPLPERRFDVIHTEQVMEHLAAPLMILRQLRSLLVPGGVVKISVPDGRRVKTQLATADWAAPKGSLHSLNAVAPLEHLNCFHHDSLVQMAHVAGLKPVKFSLASRYAGLVGFDGTWWARAKRFTAPVTRPIFLDPGTNVFFEAE